jgi:NitT/TauT family transport system substrate-binding protein
MRELGIQRGAGAALLALTLSVAPACGSAGASDPIGLADAAPAVSLRVPTGLDAGCGPAARTDPSDVAADRTVARCAPGTPAPRPLADPVRLTVGVQAREAEVAALLVASEQGELAAENLDVEVVEIPDARELWAALGTGEVDAVVGDLDAPFFDLASSTDGAGEAAGRGAGVRLVLGGPIARSAGDRRVPQPGLWVRDDALSDPGAWSELNGQVIALEDGTRDASLWPIENCLRQVDISVDSAQVVEAAGDEAVTRLRDARVAAAWLDEAQAREIAGVEGFSLVATPPVGESLGGVVLSGRLVDPAGQRAVGLALVRALIRTMGTHLEGDGGGAYVDDWELRAGTTGRLQAPYLWLGSVRYDREIPESRLVDRSLYEEVVGDGSPASPPRPASGRAPAERDQVQG